MHLTAVDAFGTPAQWRQRIAGVIAVHRGPFLLPSTLAYSRAAAEKRAAESGLRGSAGCEPMGRRPLLFRICELPREAGSGHVAPEP